MMTAYKPTKTLTQEIEGLLYTWGRRRIRPEDLKKTIKNNHERWMKYKAKGDHVRQRKYEIRTLALSYVYQKRQRAYTRAEELLAQARAVAADTDAGKDVPIQTNPTIPHLREKGFTNE